VAEARAAGGGETLDAGLYEALCIDLEEDIRKVIAAFLGELQQSDDRADEHFLAIPTVLTRLLVNFISSFGREGVTVRGACVEIIDSVIAANGDEIAELVRARRAHDGAGTA